MSVRDHEKARRYISLLDTARCNGTWHEVPELIRKVTKHAPERKCLITTAHAEHTIATQPPGTRPSTAASTTEAGLPGLIPDLLAAIDAETAHPQDQLQAQTCLAWIHWTLAEPSLILSRLPKDYNTVVRELASDKANLTGWTEVCLVKGGYFKGFALYQTGSPTEALETFQTLLPVVTAFDSPTSSSKEYTHWLCQFLAQLAMLACKDEEIVSSQEITALKAFRTWAVRAQKQQDLHHVTNIGSGNSSLLEVWKAYFQFLSKLLREDYTYPADSELSPRLQQYLELKRVESLYENALLKSVRFPKSHESNAEVENWVEQVIQNWKIVCGPTWNDEEVGQGGKDAVGRTVLDVLYRAATKTFHSTLVLRRLFQVHKSLAEFELAYKALDTYIELFKRGLAKAEKDGAPATDIDDIETIIATLSEGIECLCCYGSAEDAERAREMAAIIEEWVEVPESDSLALVNGNGKADPPTPRASSAPAKTRAIAYRSIGIAKAQWARYTPFSEDRSSIQREAIAYLKTSVSIRSEDLANYEAYFALGLILAETRDMVGAIQYVKEALASPSLATAISDTSFYERERKLIPLWHLLALILSGRQDFATAEKACEGALEQFSDPQILFGHEHHKYLNGDAEKRLSRHQHSTTGLVDTMGGFELERIIEIRMTQIALVEVVDGPEVAVNSTDELLGLFVRLFGKLGVGQEETPEKKAELVPPKSSAGTIKSFRGSIFSRKRGPRGTVKHPPLPDRSSAIIASELERTNTVTTQAPTIQVTDENQGSVKAAQDDHHEAHQHHKLHKREGSITKKIRQHHDEKASRQNSSYVSSQRQSFETGREQHSRSTSRHRDSKIIPNGTEHSKAESNGDISADSIPRSIKPTAGVNQSPSAKQQLPNAAHNQKPNSIPPPSGHKDQPPKQDIRMPTVHPNSSSTQPYPLFPHAQSEKHALGLLVKIWLLVAGLYRRASMFEDSREACDEAERNANKFEALIASQESSAKAFAAPARGGIKSSDELFADIYAEKGLLSIARSFPHEAIDYFEQALSYSPHHGKASIALSTILLDIYAQVIPADKLAPGIDTGLPIQSGNQSSTTNNVKKPNLEAFPAASNASSIQPDDEYAGQQALRKTPSNLSRLAARDRAYGLLSAYTKLGTGWDDSEAWFALARAYEESGQIDKARDVLWWTVELEDGKPVRNWRNLGAGGYVL